LFGEPERADVLAQEAGNAIAAARRYLSVAVTIGDETRAGIARCENDVAELRTQSVGIRNGDYPRKYLRNAQDLAETTDRGLRTTQGRVIELNDYLNSAGAALDVGRRAVQQLDEQRPTFTAEHGQLRLLVARIEALSDGLDQARPAVQEAHGRLARARGNLEPLLYGSVDMQNRTEGSLAVETAGEAAAGNLRAAHAGVMDSQTRVQVAIPSAEKAAHGTAVLSDAARAARAASSPGFPCGRTETPSSTKQTIEIWPKPGRGRDKGSELDR
jgi:hypothetical protein